ncbi:hypothetical protein EVAR_30387_1 [Eumeta japonica]|uniref:Histone-lysine N-methyltransferase SETMAR n=1 Tax=Eumeta variegata TaxID=151549 RepID=A0A4C1W4J6_EUMVA|nr:hypothetical protein EVAR_30387_1 [Eumeta japonica]
MGHWNFHSLDERKLLLHVRIPAQCQEIHERGGSGTTSATWSRERGPFRCTDAPASFLGVNKSKISNHSGLYEVGCVRSLLYFLGSCACSNFDIKDEPRSGRPVMDKVDAILEKVEQDRHISSYDIADELRIDHKTVLSHLKKAKHTKAPYLGPNTGSVKKI